MLTKNPYSNFRTAVATSFFLVLTVVGFLFFYGKTNSFIIINGAYNAPLDYVFQYVTVLGDGLMYIPLLLYCILFNRKFFVPLIAGIIVCTIITQFMKRVVFPHELRPFSLEMQNIIVHKIEGVPLNRKHSFPSGHTSTAFTMALLLVSVLKNRIWAFVLPVIAFFVGYSRVYLAQHFPTDVCAGMVIGMVSAYLALLVYDVYRKKYGRRQAR